MSYVDLMLTCASVDISARASWNNSSTEQQSMSNERWECFWAELYLNSERHQEVTFNPEHKDDEKNRIEAVKHD